MNAKTLEAVTKHGNALLAAFPNATEKDPVALCKKLRRIETAISRWTLQACTGPKLPEGKLDTECDKAEKRVVDLLRCYNPYQNGEPKLFIINRDPRGSALKLDDAWTARHNEALRKAGKFDLVIHQDWGGYGILAPDLN